jgi:hypothetical protein
VQFALSGANIVRFPTGPNGLEDLANAEQGVPNLVLAEMSARLKENLELRSDKAALRSGHGRKEVADNVRFFDAVEGLGALSAATAVNGWYIATHPCLGLARQIDLVTHDA